MVIPRQLLLLLSSTLVLCQHQVDPIPVSPVTIDPNTDQSGSAQPPIIESQSSAEDIASKSNLQKNQEQRVSVASEQEIPASQGQEVPVVSEQNIPASQGQDIPMVSEQEMPLGSEQEIPTASEQEIPAVQQSEITSVQNEEIPTVQKSDNATQLVEKSPQQVQAQAQKKIKQQQQRLKAQQEREEQMLANRRDRIIIEQYERKKNKQQEFQKTEEYRIRKQQQRLQKMKRRREQFEQRRRREQETMNYESDAKISLTQQTRRLEKRTMRESMNLISSDIDYHHSIFEIGMQIEEFIIHPTTTIEFFIQISVYIEENNVYGFIKDVDGVEPIRIYVYQDETHIVSDLSCYFEGMIEFLAKADSVYSIRFYNSGLMKLIVMNYPSYLSHEHASKLYQFEQGENHFDISHTIMRETRNSLHMLQKTKFLDIRNAARLNQAMRRYFHYQLLQIIVVIGISFAQLHIIKNAFKNTSIL